MEDAEIAEEGGADRLELCSALAVGGLTPSLATLKHVRAATKIKVVAMLRPRSGGCEYSESEWKTILEDARLFLDHGADGLVFGAIREGKLDESRVSELVSLAEKYRAEIVFHRAFDFLTGPIEVGERLADLGVTRILTSGGLGNAIQGQDTIRSLVEQLSGRIEILPGGGIRPHNVRGLIAATACQQVHCSLRKTALDPTLSSLFESPRQATASEQIEILSLEDVRAMRMAIDKPTL